MVFPSSSMDILSRAILRRAILRRVILPTVTRSKATRSKVTTDNNLLAGKAVVSERAAALHWVLVRAF